MLMGFRSKVNFTTDNKKPPVKVALLTLVQCIHHGKSVFGTPRRIRTAPSSDYESSALTYYAIGVSNKL